MVVLWFTWPITVLWPHTFPFLSVLCCKTQASLPCMFFLYKICQDFSQKHFESILMVLFVLSAVCLVLQLCREAIVLIISLQHRRYCLSPSHSITLFLDLLGIELRLVNSCLYNWINCIKNAAAICFEHSDAARISPWLHTLHTGSSKFIKVVDL